MKCGFHKFEAERRNREVWGKKIKSPLPLPIVRARPSWIKILTRPCKVCEFDFLKKKQIFLLFRGEEEWKRKGRKIIEGKFGPQRKRRTEEEKGDIIWGRKSKGRKIFGKGNCLVCEYKNKNGI